MDSRGYVVVLVTASNRAEAERIRTAVIDRRDAACVSIVSGVNSAYWWQGKIESAEETLLMIKTLTSKIDRIVDTVKKTHSYSVPEIIALPIVGGNDDYLDWINREVS
jgi:periplasmic divalent cation tolerance protein